MLHRSRPDCPACLLVLACCVLVIVAACAPAPAASARSTPAPAPAATLAPAAPAPPKTKPAPTPVQRSGSRQEVILATTTSTQDSGLLDVLLPDFAKRTGYRVKPISVGTGASLALGARGEADVVLVHAPEAEQKWMAEGNGTQRLLVMHNDFIIVGPPNDPAGIKGEASAPTALKRIAERRSTWVSRDDNSGTNLLEQQLWKASGVAPAGQPWLVVSGQGMGSTLVLADQKDAYTLTDRGTYLARRGSLRLGVMVQGDRQLLNVYHVMPVNASRFPSLPINAAGGEALARYMVSPEAQALIAEFGKDRFGEPLFFPDAGEPEEQP